MAIRQTTLVLKHTSTAGKILPNTGILFGEPLVNISDGIMYFRDTSSGFFEVGSNLTNLKISDKITSYGGVSDLTDKVLVGTSSGFVLSDISGITTNTYVTGGTYDNADMSLSFSGNNSFPSFTVPNVLGIYLTGATLVGSDADLSLSDGSKVVLDLSALNVNDTKITGFTYSSSNNELKITDSDNTIFGVNITEMSGLTVNGTIDSTSVNTGTLKVSDLTSGSVVHVGVDGQLVDSAGFTYGSNFLTAPNIQTSTTGSANIGTGGLTIGSGGTPNTAGVGNVVIHGNLTVFGDSIEAHTSQLYVEDSQIELNYNPTGDTSATSLGAGWLIQDGNGLTGGDVNWEIRNMNHFAGIGNSPDISEYSGPTGFNNRAFVTQLNDIVIRSNDVTAPNGVRVLGEFDTLDGGEY